MSESENKRIIELVNKKTNTDYGTANIVDLDLTNDLGFNSISFIELIVEIEKLFEIEFDDNMLQIEYLSSIKEVCRAVEIIKGRDEKCII